MSEPLHWLIVAVCVLAAAVGAVWAEMVRVRRAEERCREQLAALGRQLGQTDYDRVQQHDANVRRLEELLRRWDHLDQRPGPGGTLS